MFNERRLCSVDPITRGTKWSAQAALGDVMSEVETSTPVIIIYTDKKGRMCVRTANMTNEKAVFLLTAQQQVILGNCK